MKWADKISAKGSSTVRYATFDLQAVLTSPFAGDCLIYYSRKLSVLNFTIFDSKENGICYLWPEIEGKKGSSEIGTCLLKYLQNLPNEVERVIFYADTCGGQNRNQHIVAALVYAVNRVGSLQTIDLKFMESGHSYLEADSVHAAIERSRKHKTLYVLNDYKLIIEMSRKKPFPYVVNEVHHYDIFDLHQLSQTLITNRKKTVKQDTIKWLLVKWFRFERNKLSVGFKYDVTDPEFQYMNINQQKTTWTDLNLKKKYSAQLPLSLAKKKDLLNLLRKGVIPNEYSSFYNSLPAGTGTTDEAIWNVSIEENEDDPES